METDYFIKQLDYSGDDDDDTIFHDAHKYMLSEEGHYFDLSDPNKNEVFGFVEQNADDDELVRMTILEDNLFSNYIVINDNTDTSKRGGSKDVKSCNRGGEVSVCHLKSWIRCRSMLGMQPIYPLVQYGMCKTLVKWPGSSDWIKHYLKDIDMLASMVQTFMASSHGVKCMLLRLQSRLIVMQGSVDGGYRKKRPLNKVIQEALGSRWSSMKVFLMTLQVFGNSSDGWM
jgi:hypothetical protein